MGSYFSRNSYADIITIETTGASLRTAQQDGLGYSGLRASQTMAQSDMEEMRRYETIIKRVACEKRVDPALIAGIISRESRAGRAIRDNYGYSPDRRTWGLMQTAVTLNRGRCNWESEEHLRQGTEILVDCIEEFSNRFPCMTTKQQQLKGGIATYDIGIRKIHCCDNVDEYTTNGDYANDVVARAQWYKCNGF